jgi:hypothetical protein
MSGKDKSFYYYFKENMNALGLPAPESLFGNVASAAANTTAIVAAVEKFGSGVTISELVGAGTLSEGLIVVGGCTAAFYVGACIGSLAVATGKYFSGGLSIGDLFACAKENGIPTSSWLQKTYLRNPELYDTKMRGVEMIALRKAQWAKARA